MGFVVAQVGLRGLCGREARTVASYLPKKDQFHETATSSHRLDFHLSL